MENRFRLCSTLRIQFFDNRGYPLENRLFTAKDTTNSKGRASVTCKRCYNCGKVGHFRSLCQETQLKSPKQLQRDKLRIQNYLLKKTCQHFPFSGIDDLDFREIVRPQSVDVSEYKELCKTVKTLKYKASKLESVIDTIKEDRKQTKTKLWAMINCLKTENRKLRTNLQKKASKMRDFKEDLEYHVDKNEKVQHKLALSFRESEHLKDLKRDDEAIKLQLYKRVSELEKEISTANIWVAKSNGNKHSQYQRRHPFHRGRHRDFP